jgi:DNA polymerase V
MSDLSFLDPLNLNEYCINNPVATYLLRVKGNSMIDAGIYDGDILVVDRAIEANHGDIVVAEYNREFTVKRLETQPEPRLVPANKDYPPMPITPESEFELFGVVRHSIHDLRQ